MEEHPDIPHSGHVVGPVPLDALTFPDRCIRCGKAARFEAHIRKQTGLGVILSAIISACSFFSIRSGDSVELAVPVCWLCRELQRFARWVGLLMAIGLASAVLWAAFRFSYAVIPVTGLGPYVLIVIGLVLLIFWFAGTRGIALADRLILKVQIVSLSAGRLLVLRFKDVALAQEVAQNTEESRRRQRDNWLSD